MERREGVQWSAVLISTLIVGAFLAPSAAEEKQHWSGPIVVTFHSRNVDHSKSEVFHVVKQNGVTRWQNFKEAKTVQKDANGVYLITDPATTALRPVATPEQKTAFQH